MRDLIRSFGPGLASVFVLSVTVWAVLLIILPQVTMLDTAFRKAPRERDSTTAESLATDADTCIAILERLEPAGPAAPTGGLAVPSIGGATPLAVPSVGGTSPLTVPSIGGTSPLVVPSVGGAAPGVPSIGGPAPASGRGYILQCDRTTTARPLVRDPDAPRAMLDETYDLPLLVVDPALPVAAQIAAAREIGDLAATLATRLKAEEASGWNLTLSNFAPLPAAREIPLSPEQKAIEDGRVSKQLYGLAGLRFEEDGRVQERLGLITLARTIFFAILATALSLLACYPIAYKLALATPANQARWLMLALVIPYAIAELMRIYAWTAILDNRGLINSVLDGVGVIDLATDGPIAFKRSPITVFVVIVYTYILFMVFPIYNVVSTLDRNQLEAARDLGASTWRIHRRIVIPHARPGIAVGCIATFMLAAGAFSVPRIISAGLQGEWFAQSIYNKFFESQNTNAGSAYVVVFVAVCFAIVGVFMWAMRTRLKDFARV